MVIPRLERRILKCTNCNLLTVDSLNGSFSTLDFEDEETRQQRYKRMLSTSEEEGKFDKNMIRLEESVRTLHFKTRKEEIERYVKTGNLLDIGCGRGFFLANFIGTHIDYRGIEPRKQVCEEAEKRVGKNKIFCGTLKEANFPDSHFDIVTMLNLIEHLPNPKENLQEVNRVIKKGGLIFIETPNADSFFAKILGKRWHAFLEREHHYFFTRITLKRILTDTGFTVKKIQTGNKLFSIRYLLYRLNWYTKTVPFYLNKALGKTNLLNRTVRIPQIDELIVTAEKVTDLPNPK
jgi:2-polyprenyl-3-methyl-5-hydroxy-6-metoxy-1,4-benzoquinol methylase